MVTSRSSHRARALVVLLLLFTMSTAVTKAEEPLTLYYFWGNGCPVCARQKPFLEQLMERYPQIRIREYEVWYNAEHRDLLFAMAAERDVEVSGVPVTMIGPKVWVGFNDAIAIGIELAIRAELQSGVSEPEEEEHTPGPSVTPKSGPLQETANFKGPTESSGGELLTPPDGSASEVAEVVVDVPIVGRVDLSEFGLTLSTLVIAFVDGLNPCSLWVLSILLALVIHSRSRRKVLLVGITFLLVTTLVYGAFMLGLFSTLQLIGYTLWLRIGVAVITLFIAVVNIKDYFAFQKGLSLTISPRAKPGIYERMRGVMNAERPLRSIGLTAALAALVSLVELPCTAGFPVMWTNMVAQSGVGRGMFALLLGLYLLVFIVDELILFLLATATMRVRRLGESEGRVLKLVAGVLMLFLSVTMVIKPELMQDVTGALTVFLLSFATIAIILLIDRVRQG